ncbi:hypothetical protein DV735_g1783, partial [Chaetothyriales sp. CBS 134920]
MADEDVKESPSLVASGSSEDESDTESVELLVTGRERRKTAGNRYNRDLILQEAGNQAADDDDEDDEVALLFAGGLDEEDDEFKSDAAEDEDMSSSDDDDDQGGGAGGAGGASGDDLEGEKEIDRQRKEERARKRKAELALTGRAAIRKRPRIDPAGAAATGTGTTRPPLPKKPSKKKERVTWLPDQDAGGRASLRKQTVAHREHMLARLRESEAQSKKLKALKAIRDRERAKDAPKAMTQADRLAEAERVERRNAKSLNRWEAMEKKRSEEQAAKLAALKDRKLEGPVITWWSGKAIWRRPLFTDAAMDGGSPVDGSGEPKKRGRKPKYLQEQLAATSPPDADKADKTALLPGIHEIANLPDDSPAAGGGATGDSAVLNTLSLHKDTPMPDAPPSSVVAIPIAAATPTETCLPTPHPTSATPEVGCTTGSDANSAPSLSVHIPPVPIIEEFTTKNLVALDKLDELSDQERVTYNVFFRNKRVPRPPQRRPELCPITTQVARYKDPATGIGYANLMAYKVLQELKDHKFLWSPMLGCYVGRDGAPAARGFCAMCEKQITHPSTKILYCSEACRKKDDAKPLSASTLPSSYLCAADTPAWDPRSTSPPLHAAAARRASPAPSIRIAPDDDHVFKPDPDPTEWKPKLCGTGGSLQSDAYRYLSRFQAEHEYARADRPSLAQRRKHMGMHMRTKSLTTTTPSLVSSPTTTVASFDVGYDCDFSTRPLNLRTNPLYAISPAAKSTDLVTPHIVPPSLGGSSGSLLGELTWEKKPIPGLSVRQSSALSREFS